MKRSNVWLWTILILAAGFLLWILASGRGESIASLFVDGFWNALERMVRSMFNR
jgi:membrane protease YdiL (CAAX protease family)